LAGGISTYTYDDAQPLASLLAFADAPEAFYISVKHGVEGVGDMLRKAISAALSQSAQYDQLNVVLSTVCFNYMLYVSRLRYGYMSVSFGSFRPVMALCLHETE
jgi:hypothetical protein